MKKALSLLLASIFLASCGGPKVTEIPYKEGATVLTVKGMHCSNCEGTVMTALSKLEGIEWARAESDLDEVAYTGTVNKDIVAAAIREAGYEVIP